jgi:hypothetical protein
LGIVPAKEKHCRRGRNRCERIRVTARHKLEARS